MVGDIRDLALDYVSVDAYFYSVIKKQFSDYGKYAENLLQSYDYDSYAPSDRAERARIFPYLEGDHPSLKEASAALGGSISITIQLARIMFYNGTRNEPIYLLLRELLSDANTVESWKRVTDTFLVLNAKLEKSIRKSQADMLFHFSEEFKKETHVTLSDEWYEIFKESPLPPPPQEPPKEPPKEPAKKTTQPPGPKAGAGSAEQSLFVIKQKKLFFVQGTKETEVVLPRGKTLDDTLSSFGEDIAKFFRGINNMSKSKTLTLGEAILTANLEVDKIKNRAITDRTATQTFVNERRALFKLVDTGKFTLKKSKAIENEFKFNNFLADIGKDSAGWNGVVPAETWDQHLSVNGKVGASVPKIMTEMLASNAFGIPEKVSIGLSALTSNEGSIIVS